MATVLTPLQHEGKLILPRNMWKFNTCPNMTLQINGGKDGPFQQMESEQMVSHTEYKIKLEPYLTPFTTINSTFIQVRFVRSKT